MRKSVVKRIITLTLVLMVLIGVGTVLAVSPNDVVTDTTGVITTAGSNPSTETDLVHRGDLYMAGQSCVVTGEVTSNVMVAGSDVHLSKAVVGASCFVGASKYTGSADVGGSMYIFAADINDDSTVKHNIYVFGNVINLTGNYGLSVIAYGATVHIDGNIEGDLTVGCEELSFGESASINGKVSIDIGSDKALESLPPEYRDDARVVSDPANKSKPIVVRTLIVSPIFLFLLGLVFLRFWEKKFQHVKEMVKEKFGWSILAGLGVLILTPIVAIITIVILWPASFFPMLTVAFSAFFIAYLGGIVIMKFIGDWFWGLFGKTINKYLSLLTGVVLVQLLFMLPLLVSQIAWITVPAFLLLYITGAGAFVLSIFTSKNNAQNV